MVKKIYYKPSIMTGNLAAWQLVRKMRGDIVQMVLYSPTMVDSLRKELLIGFRVLQRFSYDRYLRGF